MAYRSVSSGIGACGLFEAGAPRKDGSFSIKDVCDKIIHANDIFKPIEPGVRGACCRVRFAQACQHFFLSCWIVGKKLPPTDLETESFYGKSGNKDLVSVTAQK